MFYRQSMLFVGFLKEKDPDGFKKLILAVQSGVEFRDAFLSAFQKGVGVLLEEFKENLT